jgi:hypothetical protein
MVALFLNAQTIVVPDSSVVNPQDAGIRSHIHFLIRVTANTSNAQWRDSSVHSRSLQPRTVKKLGAD